MADQAPPGGFLDPEDPGDQPAPAKPGDAVPQQYSGAFMQFLKTLASYTGDLSALTCPAFLLSTTSLTEYSAYWADHPDLLAAIPKASKEEERMVAVLRWFVSTLYGSYYSRCAKGFEKKPYNPVLGEEFFCTFKCGKPCGATRLACEQVSHHPPITAFYIENLDNGVFLSGHCGQKSSFKGTSIRVQQTGRVILRTLKHPEIYIVTYPEIHIRSLYTGSPFLELTAGCEIRSSNGFTASITFVPKPWFSGTYHQFNVAVFRSGRPNNPLYTGSGRWMAKSSITEVATGRTETLFDAEASPMAERIVAPVEQQHPLESRRLWLKVTKAIEGGNYSNATDEKKLIEEAQRQAKRERESSGSEWHPKLFHFVRDELADENSDGFLTSPTEAGGSSKEKKSKERKNNTSPSAAAAGNGELPELAPGEGGSWVYNESHHLKNKKG